MPSLRTCLPPPLSPHHPSASPPLPPCILHHPECLFSLSKVIVVSPPSPPPPLSSTSSTPSPSTTSPLPVVNAPPPSLSSPHLRPPQALHSRSFMLRFAASFPFSRFPCSSLFSGSDIRVALSSLSPAGLTEAYCDLAAPFSAGTHASAFLTEKPVFYPKILMYFLCQVVSGNLLVSLLLNSSH